MAKWLTFSAVSSSRFRCFGRDCDTAPMTGPFIRCEVTFGRPAGWPSAVPFGLPTGPLRPVKCHLSSARRRRRRHEVRGGAATEDVEKHDGDLACRFSSVRRQDTRRKSFSFRCDSHISDVSSGREAHISMANSSVFSLGSKSDPSGVIYRDRKGHVIFD